MCVCAMAICTQMSELTLRAIWERETENNISCVDQENIFIDGF